MKSFKSLYNYIISHKNKKRRNKTFMKKLTIDRIEENTAVCEKDSGEMINIRLSELPDGAKEGDIIHIYKDGSMKISEKETDDRKQELFDLQESLFNKE